MTIKRGHTKGLQRWYCKTCGRTFVGHHRLKDEAVNIRYAKGNLTVEDLASEYGVSTRTIYRKLTKTYKEMLPWKQGRSVVVLMDTTYWGRNFGVVLMKDSIQGDVLWYKFIERHEHLDDYREGIIYLKDHGYTIQGIVSDGFKGLREMFPQYKFQLCQFHQVLTIKTKLTLRPKLEASQELLAVAKTLCHTDKESFVASLHGWYEKWETFLKERTKSEDGKSHYTHKKLRSAYLSLERNMPWLWTWYDYPELNMPNTNNGIESLNADLKIKLNLHKGISSERRKIFIQDFINAHKSS
jgi:hypothetical protein